MYKIGVATKLCIVSGIVIKLQSCLASHKVASGYGSFKKLKGWIKDNSKEDEVAEDNLVGLYVASN